MITLRTLLERLWAKHTIPAVGRRQWCAPIRRSDVIDRIMAVVARQPGARPADLGMPDDHPGGGHHTLDLPRLDAYLEPGVAPTVRGHFAAAGWEITVLLTAVARRLADDVRATLDTLPPDQRPSISTGEISEWAAGVAVKPYRDGPALPDAVYLAAATAKFWQDRTGPAAAARAAARMPATEFARRYEQDYEQLWHNDRDDAAGRPCPVRLGLGRLCRPPLSGPESSWRSGTDRSVLSRYHRYVRRRDWSRDIPKVAREAGLDPDQHVSVRIIGVAPEHWVRTELDRVRAPLGLHLTAHHAMVTTTARALVEADVAGSRETPAPGSQRVLLGRWAEAAPDLCAEEDPELHAALVGYASGWAGQDPWAVELARLTGDLVTWSVQVELGVLRRIWHKLHGREVEWEAPLRRAEVPRLVRGAFSKHLVELLGKPIEDVRDGGAGEPEVGPSRVPMPDDPRLAATLVTLGPDGLRALLALLSDAGEWRAAYLAVVGETAGLLEPEELRHWLALNLRSGESGAG